MKIMNEQMVKLANFFAGQNGEKMGALARAEIFKALFWGSESHSLIRNQIEILMASQGSTYKPFVSGEVNRALANLIQSGKAHTDLVKLMIPSNTGPGTIINNTNLNASGNKVNYLSVDQAVTLIRQEAQSMIENPNLLPQLENVPDICARTQDLTKIGIKNHIPLLPSGKEPSTPTESQFEHGNRDEIIDIEE